MEFARSAAAARRRADGVGSIDPALRALAGTVAVSNRSAGHQQERDERALGVRHRAQVGGADEPGSAPVCGEIQLRRRPGSERGHCSVFASGMSQGLRLDTQARRRAEPA
jgi:hypothetical protein